MSFKKIPSTLASNRQSIINGFSLFFQMKNCGNDTGGKRKIEIENVFTLKVLTKADKWFAFVTSASRPFYRFLTRQIQARTRRHYRLPAATVRNIEGFTADSCLYSVQNETYNFPKHFTYYLLNRDTLLSFRTPRLFLREQCVLSELIQISFVVYFQNHYISFEIIFLEPM